MYDSDKAHYIAATCIIVKDGKFLITKRAAHEKAFPNMWTVPGGKLEVKDYQTRPKDTNDAWYNVMEDLLRREVKEETNLEIKNIRYLASLTFIRPDGIPALVLSFFADYSDGDVKLCRDLSEHAWIDLEQAKQYNFISGIFEELGMIDRILKGENVGEWKKGLI